MEQVIGILYITLGVLYIIACVMDGQDVKPLWKKWVSRRLEKSANYFFPIKYVTETKYKYVPVEPPTPWERCAYERTEFNSEKINATNIITEGDIQTVLSMSPYRRDESISQLIRERKSRCVHAICKKIADGGYITVEEDRRTHYPNILIRAWVYVGKRKE